MNDTGADLGFFLKERGLRLWVLGGLRWVPNSIRPCDRPNIYYASLKRSTF